MTQKIDIRLERDPNFSAAKARFTELQKELTALERQRDNAESGIGSQTSGARDRVAEEATALLSGAPAAANPNREALMKTLDELTHRLAVLRSAVELQRGIVSKLRAEVGKAIATDLLPQHRANAQAVARAVFQLNAALEVEHDLRETLNQNGVPYSSCIRPMPFPGFGLLRDPTSRAAAYLLEAYEYAFITPAELPDNLKPFAAAKKRKPMPSAA